MLLPTSCGERPPALVRKLQDSNELVRIEAAESLGAIGDKNALTALWKALADRSSLVRSYVAGAIGELGSRKEKHSVWRVAGQFANGYAEGVG